MADLLQWWNLVYVLAFFFALLYAALSAIGLASHGVHADVGHDVGLDHDVDAHFDMDHDVHVDFDHDVDAHFDMDHDVHVDFDHDVDAHVGLDHDVDVHADVDHDVEADVHVDAAHTELSILEVALSFFGVGRVPLSILLMTFLITFAVVGWGVNTLLKDALLSPAAFFPLSCAAAVFCGLSGTKLLASTLGRFLKPLETAATPRSALVGRIATTVLPVTEQFGQAHVHDDYGSLHKVTCKVPEGAEPIAKGQSVLLVRYVRVQKPGRRASGYYLVEPYDVPES